MDRSDRSLSLFAVLFLLAATPTNAATLQDVKNSLSALRGATPLRVAVASSDVRSDGKTKGESRGNSVIADDGTRIHLIHEKKDLLPREDKKRGADYSVDAGEAAELLNYAPSLLRVIDKATLKRMTSTMRSGKPVTLLELTPVREKDEDGDKWVKNYVDTLLLWVDARGVPVAAERTKQMKVRFVVVGFEIAQKDELQFEPANDHLVVTKRTTASSGSGLGQGESGVKTVVASILREPAA
jgi:hypothetical protein